MIVNPAADANTTALAAWAGLSARHLARLFRHDVGVTPAGCVDGVRVDLARRRLEAGERPKQVAAACGFGDVDTFRRAFGAPSGPNAGGVPPLRSDRRDLILRP